MSFLDFLVQNDKLLYLIAGAGIGFVSSYLLWKLNLKHQEKKRRLEEIRNMVRSVLVTGSFCRSLLYAKPGGIEAVGKLGPNPLDELMAFTMIGVSEIGPQVQEMNCIMSEIYAHDIKQQGTSETLIKKCKAIESLVDQACNALVKIAEKEKLDAPPYQKIVTDWNLKK